MAALFYDTLLSLVLLLAATAMAHALFSYGDHTLNPSHLFFRIYLLSVLWAYYAYCWIHSGQTLGAKAWKLAVRSKTNKPLTWPDTVIRFGVALLGFSSGINLIWWFFDRGHLLHDRYTATHLVSIS